MDLGIDSRLRGNDAEQRVAGAAQFARVFG
jgi:hypothetical protein